MRADWQHALEIHPAGWRFPAGKSWIAGWLVSRSGRAPADVRAWIDKRPFLGLCALPRPEVQQTIAGRADAPAAGFSFLLEPHRGARRLRLEVCDLSGEWEEFATLEIAVADDAPAPPSEPAPDYAALLRALLQSHRRRPTAPLDVLAADIVAEHRAQPLDTEPNPPFWGKLEEPAATGRLKYGRLTVTGWLAHKERAITALTAVLDPQAPTPLLHGQPRRDVSGLFADLRGTENSQFLGNVDLPAGLPLPAALRIFATLDNGHTELVFTRRFRPTVVAGAEPPPPAFSPTHFFRCALALRRAAKAQQLPASGFLAAVRTAWRAYRDDAPRVAASASRLSPLVFRLSSVSRPLRVLLATHNLNLEGAPLFLFEYARYLAAQPGFVVHLVSPADGPLRERFAAAGIAITIVDLQSALTADNKARFHSALAQLAPRFAAEKYDLVVANTMVAFWGVQLARQLGVPALLYIHESAPVRRFFAPLLPAALIPEVEAAFGLAARVAFIAAASLPVHARHERRGNFAYTPSWIDVTRLESYRSAHSRAALRARLGLPADALVIANIGSVCERKGQHIYVRAIELLEREFARAATALPPRRYLMVGGREGIYLDSLRHDIALRRLENIEIVPEVDDPFAYYGAADVFVCSSFEEAFPRVLLEAAVFELPIASTDVNGVPEMLGADDAWLCPPGDPARLAAAMRGAIESVCANDRTRTTRAKSSVVARFDARTNLPQHLALTHSVAARSR
ncbi:MAG TPA: glycosyltransferase family 4 protein [Opitutaceae bacterium]|nr:glycosyltransferase family 4 protein [Opitutaceae bacterium]